MNKSTIGDFSYVGMDCVIQNASIGKYCSIANRVTIGPGKHPATHFSTSPVFYRERNPSDTYVDSGLKDFQEFERVTIGHDVWIGCNAVIIDGVKIGTGSIIAAGAIVTKDVPPYTIVAGIPAQVIRQRFSSNSVIALLESNWWDKDPQEVPALIEKLDSIEK